MANKIIKAIKVDQRSGRSKVFTTNEVASVVNCKATNNPTKKPARAENSRAKPLVAPTTAAKKAKARITISTMLKTKWATVNCQFAILWSPLDTFNNQCSQFFIGTFDIQRRTMFFKILSYYS